VTPRLLAHHWTGAVGPELHGGNVIVIIHEHAQVAANAIRANVAQSRNRRDPVAVKWNIGASRSCALQGGEGSPGAQVP
jgi:hypothetical protein